MFGSFITRESQRGDNSGSLVLEGPEINMSRKREASPGMGLSPGTLAGVSESAGGQKRRQTSHSGRACRQSAQILSEDIAMLRDIVEPSSPPGRNLLQVTYGTPTYCNAQPAWGASAGLGGQPAPVRGTPWEHWSNGVSAEADCFAFQYGHMDVETPDDSWLDTQTDFAQPTFAPNIKAGTPPLFAPPSLPSATAPALGPQQHAITAAESHQVFAQRQSNCLALKRSSQDEGPLSGGRAAPPNHCQQQQQQQQQTERATKLDSRLSFEGGVQSSLGWQGPLRPGSCFYASGSASCRRGWTWIQAPTPTPNPTATSTPIPDLDRSVYRFQGSSSTRGVQVGHTSRVRGIPGGVGVHPPMGIAAPGSSPAPTPVAQPCRDGAHRGTAPQPPQLQQQHILTQMQLSMTHAKKLQQLLDTGRSVLGEALTPEEGLRYQEQCRAVLAQHKRLKTLYNMQCRGRVEITGCEQPSQSLINQQERAVEAAKGAALLQEPPQGTPQDHPLGQGGLSGCPHAPRAAPVAVGWNARQGYGGSGTFGNADAVEDDYDRDLQAALAASVAHQPGSQAAPHVKSDTESPTTNGLPRAVPCNASAAREAAQLEEITRRTAEPLMVRAHNGGGIVWQNERDHSVPKGEPPTPPTPQAYVPPEGGVISPKTAARAETKSMPAAAAAGNAAAESPPADSPPGGLSADSDSCAEKVGELSLETNPAGLRLAQQVREQEEDLSLLKALSSKELQAYGPQSESGYTTDDLCEDVDDLDIGDGVNGGSEGAVSDTCSEEQEDFQVVRLAADEEAVSKAAQDAQLQDDWVFAEAEESE